MWHHQPIYHATFLDFEGSHDVHHDNIFIPRDHDDALDPQGLLVPNMDQLRIPDALDAQAMRNTTKHPIQKWGSMDSTNFNVSTSAASIKDEHLNNDFLTTTIKIFLRAANKWNMVILPQLPELPPTNSTLTMQAYHHLCMQNMAMLMLSHAMPELVIF